MNYLSTLAVAATAALTMGTAASALVVINPGDVGGVTATLSPGATVTFEFESNAPQIWFSTSGTGLTADLADVTYTITGSGVTTWDEVHPGSPGAATGSLPSWSGAGPFTVTFFDGINTDVQVTLSYAAPIPLPAAGFLLAGGLGLLGLRRKS